MLHPISRSRRSVLQISCSGFPVQAQKRNNISFKLKTYSDGKAIKTVSKFDKYAVVESIPEAFPSKGDAKWCDTNHNKQIINQMSKTVLPVTLSCFCPSLPFPGIQWGSTSQSPLLPCCSRFAILRLPIRSQDHQSELGRQFPHL